nr:DUF1830 domain-containing protein [Acaryochloris sp. IP29b_bin.137]
MLNNQQITDASTTTQSLSSDPIYCKYLNPTNHIQITRISNIPNWYFERVVFPQQQLAFTAPPGARLEVHTSELASSILSDRIPCIRLQVDKPPKI